MTVRGQWLTVGAIVAALGIGLSVLANTLGSELFPLKIGSRAPDFAAVTLPGSVSHAGLATVSNAGVVKGIDDYAGEVVLLNIWATWCTPCRVEMPSMQRLEEALGPKGLRIVAVSIDDPGMEGRIREFADELGLTFEILYDAAGEIQLHYQTTGVPETFIIGRDGRIRRRVIGADDWSRPENVAYIERLLAEEEN